MKTNVAIYSVEDKVTKKGTPMWTFKTEKGQMSVFDEGIAKELKEKGLNHICELEIVENNGYKNITNIHGIHAEIQGQPDQKSKGFDHGEANKIRQASVMISYAKDMMLKQIDVLASYCDSREEAVEVLVNSFEEIHDKARGLMELQEELIKGKDDKNEEKVQ